MAADYRLAWRPEPRDDRDHVWPADAAYAAAMVPPSADLSAYVVEVFDQGSTGSCHDDKTEVLTDEGWKLFAALDGSERLGTVNPETAELLFERPTGLTRYPYQGKMLVAEGQATNFKVTPNHNMLVRPWDEAARRLSDTYTLVPAEKMGWYCGLLARVVWKGESSSDTYTLPGVDHKLKAQRVPRQLPMAVWLRFLGFYLAEGTMLKRDTTPGRYAIQLAAGTDRKREFARQLMTDLEVNAFAPGDRFVFHNKQIYEALSALGLEGKKAGEKFIPRFVFQQNAEMVREFLLAHRMGDGSIRDWRHYTGSAQLADGLQTLAFYAGYRTRIAVRAARDSMMADGRVIHANLPEHCVSVCEKRESSIGRKKETRWEEYDGEVFCAEVPTHHTLVTRREGHILISGNCVAQSTAQAIRVSEFARSGKLPPCPSRRWIYDAARLIDRDGDIHYSDNGTYCRSAYKACANMGFCDETAFPWKGDPVGINERPPYRAYRAAYDAQRLDGYHRLPDGEARKDAMKLAISSGVAVSLGMYIDAAFQRIDSYEPWELTGPVIGGHSETAVGYDEAGVLFVGSWTKSFGVRGFHRVGWRTITSDTTSDAWAARLAGGPS